MNTARLLLSCSLFVCCSCFGQESKEITTKVSEVDRDKDGRTDFRIEEVFRKQEKILLILSRRNGAGEFAVSSRAYLVGNEILLTESDENSDGILETVAVRRPGSNDLEIFLRQKDGSVSPVDAQTLAAFGKQRGVVTEFWRAALGKEEDGGKAGKLMNEAKRKIEELEERKKVPVN